MNPVTAVEGLMALSALPGIGVLMVTTVRRNREEAAEEYAWISGPQLDGTARPIGQPKTPWVRAMLAHNDRADVLRAQEEAAGKRTQQRAERKRKVVA